MICVCCSDFYDSSVASELPCIASGTIGNKCKLLNHSFYYNCRKFSFAAQYLQQILTIYVLCLLQFVKVNMPKRQCPEAVAKQFVTNKTDPPWIEVKFIDEVKGNLINSIYSMYSSALHSRMLHTVWT